MLSNRIFSVLMFLSLTFISTEARACGSHPGQTHEQWTSAVGAEKNKDGSVKTFSDGFWGGSSQPRGESSDSGRRPSSDEGRRRSR